MRIAAGWWGIILAALTAAAAASVGEDLNFDNGWRFTRSDPAGAAAPAFDDATWQAVDLPHDWSIAGPIARDNPAGSPGGFFPTGVGSYRKTFDAPADWKGRRIAIEFDGVYMLSDVSLNGQKLGSHVSGFSPFEFDLTPHLNIGGKNTIAVRVDNSRQPNARWYTGSGINRHVRLRATQALRLARFGALVTTPRVSEQVTTVSVAVAVESNRDDIDTRFDCSTRIFRADSDGKPAGDAVADTGTVAGTYASKSGVPGGGGGAISRVTIPSPKLWTPETPNLYVAVTTLTQSGRVIDEGETTFGIRSIEVSAEKGLVINGKPVELFGACVHDDNGPLGTAAFDRAEVRRVEQLKAAGFNAVRCAHNPPAPAFLDACDRLGLLVIDEAFDSWTFGKNKEDFSRYFDEHWQDELDAMILRDRNHPSIIMWSLGNEIHDFGSLQGMAAGTKLIERAKRLDPTRLTTTAVYWFNNIGGPDRKWTWEQAGPLMSKFDVVGYNYFINRYERDHANVPGRMMVGSESYSRDLFVSWEQSNKHPYVLGDFVWTAIDYLGESGIGRYHQPDERIYFHLDARHYPYHGAYCGDIDLTGFRKPISHQRNIVWDRGETLYTSVTDVTPDGRHYKVADWGVVPSKASWTWPGQEGRAMEVQVYSRHDAVRLYLNGTLIGEKPTTQAEQFKATFDVPYAAGTLRTVGIRDGREVETSELKTAGDVAGLRLTADRSELAANGQDLAYVTVESVDSAGNLQPFGDATVTFAVDGPATIVGVVSGDYGTLQGYQGSRRTLFNGRAQVVLRCGRSAGDVSVRATANGLSEATARILVK